MNLIRRSTWLFVMLGVAAGCTGEDEMPAGTGATDAPPPALAPQKPVVPGETKTEPAPAESKEMEPAPAKEDAKAPAEMEKGNAPPKVEGPKTEAKDSTAATDLSDEAVASIKELPAADQALAMKQGVCPVSDEDLGGMGKPVKVTVEGKTFFLCCEHCEKELKANPQKYLAKLEAQKKK